MITINKLNTESRRATIELDYEDALCLVNSMFQLSTLDKIEKDDNFDEVYASVMLLHTLLKHRHLPDFELDAIHKLRCGPVKETTDVLE